MASFDPVASSPSGARLPPFHTLAKHSFVGIPFRVENVTIRGGIREHVHEYGRLPGGVAELLGRRLYEFEYDAVFATNDAEFPDAWPGTIGTFRGFWEQRFLRHCEVSTDEPGQTKDRPVRPSQIPPREFGDHMAPV